VAGYLRSNPFVVLSRSPEPGPRDVGFVTSHREATGLCPWRRGALSRSSEPGPRDVGFFTSRGHGSSPVAEGCLGGVFALGGGVRCPGRQNRDLEMLGRSFTSRGHGIAGPRVFARGGGVFEGRLRLGLNQGPPRESTPPDSVTFLHPRIALVARGGRCGGWWPYRNHRACGRGRRPSAPRRHGRARPATRCADRCRYRERRGPVRGGPCFPASSPN